ncbi:MAG: hypothetical protein VBE63_23175, partial [Lamprobacter sp.]|uniref:hypothetical protein n=1 Tax=Lamprobacter sp. TaxID=3100796 RepID=UPI002B260617
LPVLAALRLSPQRPGAQRTEAFGVSQGHPPRRAIPVVWDLIDYAKGAVFNRANICKTNCSRAVGLDCLTDQQRAYIAFFNSDELADPSGDTDPQPFLDWFDSLGQVRPPTGPPSVAGAEGDPPFALPLLVIDTLGPDGVAAALGNEPVIAGESWPLVSLSELAEQFALHRIAMQNRRARFEELFGCFEHGPCLMRCLEQMPEKQPAHQAITGMMQVAAGMDALVQGFESNDNVNDANVGCHALINTAILGLI